MVKAKPGQPADVGSVSSGSTFRVGNRALPARAASVSRRVLWMILLGATAFANAEPPSATTRDEIAALLRELGTSHCEFFRNGSWYDSARAESHLTRKLDYFQRKKLLSTTDAFIADAASRSSTSGEIYRVRCPSRQAQPSADWLTQKLAELRRRTPES